MNQGAHQQFENLAVLYAETVE